MKDAITEVFGDVISSYSRAQAIEDGVLVDVSDTAREAGFKLPVAMTLGAWEQAIAAGGEWAVIGDDPQEAEELILPGGQDVKGRLWDVFTMLKHAIKQSSDNPTERRFSVLVDTNGNGRHTRVNMKSLCGPGDNAEPVITILLPNED